MMWRLGLVFVVGLGVGFFAGRATSLAARSVKPRAARVVGGDVRRATHTHASDEVVGGTPPPAQDADVRASEMADLSRAVYSPDVFSEADGFRRWYRVHEKAYDLPAADNGLLWAFGEDVIEPLGRIPRRELLSVLLEKFRPYYAKRKDASKEEWLPLVRGLLDEYYGVIACTDYALVYGNEGWREWRDNRQIALRPPTKEGLAGGDPYGSPEWWVRNHYFDAWYRAYRVELALPRIDEEFRGEFEGDILEALGRVPRPPLLRDLIGIYRRAGVIEAFDSQVDDEASRERWTRAVRRLFGDLAKRLTPLDYDRMLYSDRWEDDCRKLGLVPE